MMIARFGMAAACVAIMGLSGSPVAAQQDAPAAPAAPSPYYQLYQQQQAPAPQNQVQQNQPQRALVPTQGAAQQNFAPQTPPQPPPPPFVLTQQQQAELDNVLADWQRNSDKVTTFKCKYTHWIYDPTFLPPKLGPKGELNEVPIKKSTGEIKYTAPDKGLIEDDDVKETTNPGTPGETVVDHKFGEHWACDGKILSAVDDEKHEIHRTPLPPEMQGKFISEGPLPFAFGTKAGPLKERYYLRVVTPPNIPGQVWLEIHPRFQKDLTNFIEVEVVLRTKDMLPTAIQITHAEVKVPIRTDQGEKIIVGRQKEVYVFDEKSDWLPTFGNPFLPSPLGYKIINNPMPGQQSAPPAGNPQARRLWPPANAPAKPY